MKKKAIMWALLDLVFVILFNVMFFMLGGTEHTTPAWIAYGFIHLAYLSIVLAPLITHDGSTSSVFGLSSVTISSVYFLVELPVGLIFIFANPRGYKASLIIQLVLFGIYFAALLIILLANEHTADIEASTASSNYYIKKSASRIKALMNILDDRQANGEIEAVYDLIYTSPAKTTGKARDIESEITQSISRLEEAVHTHNADRAIEICSELRALAEERNAILKINR